MSINCGIAQDLLPLYAEELCGEESRKALRKHLGGCKDCRAKLESLKNAESFAPIEALPMQKISRKIKRDKLRLTALVASIIFMITTVVVYRATFRHYVEYRDGLVSATLLDDGSIYISINTIADYKLEGMKSSNDGSQYEYFLSLYNEDRSGNGQTQLRRNDHSGNTPIVYYTSPDRPATPLYGAHDEFVGVQVLPRLALNYYLMFMIALLIVIALVLLIMRKRPKAQRILSYLIFIPLSYILAHQLIMGPDGTSWDMLRDFQFILLTAAFAYAAMALAAAHFRARSKG